ncbi:putative kinesin [Leptomonas pyrrhocoris]|uniref:Putative kinesin n=1 Tax=Leptomonas pyrrhocoris TaxID=157538 RepID=A0A0N0VGM9_LEPPY|nr:putative kinesin [Leptomonas pyrrhocoris]KPA83424.1 putative kinesin [Leptomonas pyrrhocoris]|eukprot:XP_015661863.1 putative kinesin [Leptomonas pyrrhocoris]
MKSTNVRGAVSLSTRSLEGQREPQPSANDGLGDAGDGTSVSTGASPVSTSSPSAAATAASPKNSKTKKAKSSLPADADAAEDDLALSRCLVYCRLRPTVKQDYKEGGHAFVTLEDRRVVVKDERHYDYDGTFGPSTEQTAVFESVAIPCIDHAFKGFCSALMCYGQTGTGKSFTMCNTDPQHLGIIPRAAEYIFGRIRASSGSDPTRTYAVVGQFVQIYRDHLGDLMVHEGRDRVEIHYDEDTGVSLTGCTSHALTNAQEFMRFYAEGNTRRVVGSTAMNAESSRGHTAMIIYISSEVLEDPSKGKMRGKITFIDLAGYERFSKTGITSADPIRKDEAKTINASLLALGHVVSSLSAGTKHVPWRNAKLTRILQDSIGGRSRTSIILTVGPSSEHLYETTNTLQFGLRAMAVKVEAKVSITVDYVKLSKKLMGLLSERDERISSLEVQIANRDAERQELLARYQRDRGDLEQRFTDELEHLTASGASEQQIRNLKEVYQVEIENLQDQQQEEIGYQDEIHSKEITQLMKEQKRQEAKSLMEMKLARERLVDEFQRKLDSARGGTNDDLVRALEQLAEKDAVLASRANDTARLHSTIDALAAQVRVLGGEASAAVEFPETFLDVSQVEEMRARLQGEVDRHYNKVVDLHTQLDRASMLAHDRMEEVSRLEQEVEELHGKLLQAGVEMNTSNEEMQALRERRAELVDPEELESLRLLMQSDIDELRSQRDDLQAEVKRVNEARTREAVAWRRNRMDGPEALRRILAENIGADGSDAALLDAVDSAGGGKDGGGGKARAMQKVYKKMIQKLNRQLADSSRERDSLVQRIQQLERTLGAYGIPEQSSPATKGEEVLDGALDYGGPPSRRGNTRAESTPDRDSSSNDSRAEEALLSSGNADVTMVLLLKEQEIDVRDDLIAQLDAQLTKALAAHGQDQKLIEELNAQLKNAGGTPVDSVARPQPVEGVPLEEYTKLLRQMRSHNRKLLVELLVSQSRPRSCPESPTTDRGVAEKELEERDTELELKDEMLLEKSAMLQYLATLGARLISQMESLGLEPCCALPEKYQDLAKADEDQLGIQAEKQRELEAKLQREQEEKMKMRRLLDAINTEREQGAAVLRQTEQRNKELRERENNATAALQELTERTIQKEMMREEAMRRTTHELMELQARLANQEHRRGTNVFERLLRSLLD